MARSLVFWLSTIQDPRSPRKKKHDLVEILVCIIIGYLSGKTTLRAIHDWCRRNIEKLRKYTPLENGIPSVPTISRILGSIDEISATCAFMQWIAEILDTRGIHVAIDGKALRGAVLKVRDEKIPYILNAMDVATKIVIGQILIHEKTNEAGMLPEFIKMLNIPGSTVTIDAIGTSENIMEAIHSVGAEFVLQVKKNCPELYTEILAIFQQLDKERADAKEENDLAAFYAEHEDEYSTWDASEHNRDRYENRVFSAYSNKVSMGIFQMDRPHINCIARAVQTRIMQVSDSDGNDVTPSYADFLANGSKRQPKPSVSDDADSPALCIGLISSKVLTAEEFARYKRDHWKIENSLHYVLDNIFGEDRCTVRKGKAILALLRKCAYNVVRLLQQTTLKSLEYVPDVLAELETNFDLAANIIFNPTPSLF